MADRDISGEEALALVKAFKPTKKHQDDSLFYAMLMEETRSRLEEITRVLRRVPTYMPEARVAAEGCFLQFRLICELIALACLVAHGDSSKVRKLRKAYSADQILDHLERLDPAFFPQAIGTVTLGRPAPKEIGPRVTVPKKTDIIALYGKCGDTLHRGTFKILVAGRRRPSLSFNEIMAWHKRLYFLLGRHMIRYKDSDMFFVCSLWSEKHRCAWVDYCVALRSPWKRAP
jgi:hypothetical protein